MQLSENRHKIYLGLGTNLGNRHDNIKRAVEFLSRYVGAVVTVSSVYETKPEGFDSDNYFLNAVCLVRTSLSPLEALEATQNIETEMGRTTKSVGGQYSDRVIDIDLLLFDDAIIDLPTLSIPHPHISERIFVLDPLAEIAPDLHHPILKKTFSELKKEII